MCKILAARMSAQIAERVAIFFTTQPTRVVKKVSALYFTQDTNPTREEDTLAERAYHTHSATVLCGKPPRQAPNAIFLYSTHTNAAKIIKPDVETQNTWVSYRRQLHVLHLSDGNDNHGGNVEQLQLILLSQQVKIKFTRSWLLPSSITSERIFSIKISTRNSGSFPCFASKGAHRTCGS